MTPLLRASSTALGVYDITLIRNRDLSFIFLQLDFAHLKLDWGLECNPSYIAE